MMRKKKCCCRKHQAVQRERNSFGINWEGKTKVNNKPNLAFFLMDRKSFFEKQQKISSCSFPFFFRNQRKKKKLEKTSAKTSKEKEKKRRKKQRKVVST